jgi:anaerobic ribonucleoside-triphosphate reductase activating protein
MNIRGYCLSKVNGPGVRFVLWTQGCSKGCSECFNPETWSTNIYKELSPTQIFELIKNFEVDGVTISGGDPLEQEDELLELLMLLSTMRLRKGVILFSGFTRAEISSNFIREQCLKYIDVLIDGRYEKNLKVDFSLKGSSNQEFYFFSNKILSDELHFDQEIEISSLEGDIMMTGFPNISRKILKELGVNLK